jgi:hypothetical protein
VGCVGPFEMCEIVTVGCNGVVCAGDAAEVQDREATVQVGPIQGIQSTTRSHGSCTLTQTSTIPAS